MNWFPILAILSGSLVYLIYNYLPNQDLLKDNWNKFFYSFIWIITSGIIIISHATPEWTAETTLLFYIAAGFSLPQMLLIILSNKSLKEENKDASDKLEQKEKDYNKLLEECESEKTYRTNLCKNHDTMLKGTVDSLILRDANFFFHLKVLKIDTDQLNEVLNIRLTNMKTIPTFTEKNLEDYKASIIQVINASSNNSSNNKPFTVDKSLNTSQSIHLNVNEEKADSDNF